jgi:hypothetical protein
MHLNLNYCISCPTFGGNMKSYFFSLIIVLSSFSYAQEMWHLTSKQIIPPNVQDYHECPEEMLISQTQNSVTLIDIKTLDRKYLKFENLNQGSFCEKKQNNGGVTEYGYQCSNSTITNDELTLTKTQCANDLPFKCNPIKKPSLRWDLVKMSDKNIELKFQCLKCARLLKQAICKYQLN